MSTVTQKQILLAKTETETLLTSARGLRDQWLVATGPNPTILTKKGVDNIHRAFKKSLLAVKWDLEDLEVLVHDAENSFNEQQRVKLCEIKSFNEECRCEVSNMMGQLEDYESNVKLFNKHGITMSNSIAQTTANVTSHIIQNPMAQYERLTSSLSSPPPPPAPKSEHDAGDEPASQLVRPAEQFDRRDSGGEIHFDKSQIEASTTIFNNSLYDHYESAAAGGISDQSFLKATQVFNNLSRPAGADVYMNPNENELILEMLETEYYNPPAGLLAKSTSRYNMAVRRMFDTDRNKILGTIALIFSFPILLILFLVI